MKTTYIQVNLDLPEPLREPAIALLAAEGYDAFHETVNGLEAFIKAPEFREEALREVLSVFDAGGASPSPIRYQTQELPAKNWNEEWESKYEGVFIDNFCQVIASFKNPEPDFRHTIFIDPKMSFGTGHHETTRLVIRMMSQFPVQDLSVLDMGCGTGVLGILASKMGAGKVTAIDIDPWSEENARENASLNDIDNLEIIIGDAQSIPDSTFDLILANINRNVLLADVPAYAKHLANGGRLIASGIYTEDKPLITRTFQEAGLFPEKEMEENRWISISFIKQ